MLKPEVVFKIIYSSLGLGFIMQSPKLYAASRSGGKEGIIKAFKENPDALNDFVIMSSVACKNKRFKHDPWDMLVLKEGLYEEGFDHFSEASKYSKIPASSISQGCARARIQLRRYWTGERLVAFMKERFS